VSLPAGGLKAGEVVKSGGGQRDRVYGVPDLPAQTPERFRDSAFADNAGTRAAS
jgi:hypothetical protein